MKEKGYSILALSAFVLGIASIFILLQLIIGQIIVIFLPVLVITLGILCLQKTNSKENSEERKLAIISIILGALGITIITLMVIFGGWSY
ncbi:MAG: hypothetical protein BWY36_00557 [Candidatus Diapherotrites archaeon ADurb.Bin253]|jgi:NADH:ubiquinone oxidoreductase subunit 6 (subunit J)|nr:MAG: hypothetical protein BWY36_00557 [Candidatus Diapherotrites archaeon ADurb.Bin253]HNZ51835.1 hypothetical protein [Candidatus Pacearchaeota archaeon]HOF44086.1 hypothetical protein [Candidatus Pacearchaeota archaeon]HOH04191.1 hypothetical protein [Candidatus Pacearchaeota archaeon]HOU79404.1 hypothetical protein [Candidatus Pacearchaeota archaeon]